MKFEKLFYSLIFSKKEINNISDKEKQKKLYLYFCSILGIPILIFFSIIEEDSLSQLLELSLSIIIFINLIIFKYINSTKWFIRSQLLSIFIIFIFFIISQTSDGNGILWSYIFPLILFYLLGKKEGFIWATLYFLIIFISVLFPDIFFTHKYLVKQRYEYVSSLFLVTIFSYWLEYSRELYEIKLNKKNKELINALDNIKTLSGLIPICSVCKKIRDDNGYWNQLENYISKHTDAIFSHGICDKCLEEKYPDSYKKIMDKRKKRSNNSN